MVYTYSRRRELNRGLKEKYPQHLFVEEKNGLPRMHAFSLPQGARRIIDADELYDAVVDYHAKSKQPMPIMVCISSSIMRSMIYDVNYVEVSDFSSINLAEKWANEGKLFALVNR